jgi:phosphoribosylformylglycinamidine cyclo-ligase
MPEKSEYAKAGVDYTLMEPFKRAMIAAGKKTLTFPNRRNIFVNDEVIHSHGAVYEYRGKEEHIWCKTQEGLGTKNWIAEWMYANEGTGRTYYDNIAIDTALMAVNDVIAQGAMPAIFTDCVEVGHSKWFEDIKRSEDFAAGFLKICEEVGMALPAGESATLKYLVKAEPPVEQAPILSGSVTGIIAPKNRLITGKKLTAGDHIIGAASSGLHANGVSLVINRAMQLPEKFLTKLPNGKTLGEEALIPTRSYVALIEKLLEEKVDIHALLPGTGDGVGKLAFDSRPFQYRVHSWGNVPPLFQYFREVLGLPLQDCLKTFNWGMGYYVFVPAGEAARVLELGAAAGYQLVDVGIVEEGERQVIFEPENITLPPPGE